MVRLSRIYTRTGDDGLTGLGNGERRQKHDPRIRAYGSVDELSSLIALLLTEPGTDALADRLRAIQNELFDVGADLCLPGTSDDHLRVAEVYTRRLEDWIDEVNDGLPALNSFVLPGGTRVSAWLHLIRTVCRRAEREVVEAAAAEGVGSVNVEVQRYLNRLSDLFFVLAREANQGRDVLWQPGASRPDPKATDSD